LHVLRIARELLLRVCHEFPEMGRLVMANYARRMATVMSALQTLLP
jgi:CRP-like cAMP-binding protein